MSDDEHMARAKILADKIERKAAAVLVPLEREMVIMKWAPAYCEIMWEAVAHRAIALAKDASS